MTGRASETTMMNEAGENRSDMSPMTGPRIALVVAMARNGVIGHEGKLPWRLPDDLKHFKALTTGHTIIMGRRTWESIGGRPLPNRRHVVITRQPNYSVDGAEVVHSFEEALERTGGEAQVFVVGGQEIYELALPRAHRLYLTLVDAAPEGDARFPEVDWSQWRTVDQTDHPADERHAHGMRFTTMDRRK
jgi:dihydrofolate reductase